MLPWLSKTCHAQQVDEEPACQVADALPLVLRVVHFIVKVPHDRLAGDEHGKSEQEPRILIQERMRGSS